VFVYAYDVYNKSTACSIKVVVHSTSAKIYQGHVCEKVEKHWLKLYCKTTGCACVFSILKVIRNLFL